MTNAVCGCVSVNAAATIGECRLRVFDDASDAGDAFS